MEFFVHIGEEGIQNKVAVKMAFESLSVGKHLVVTKPANNRSLPQNKYYWACVVPMVLEGFRQKGYSKDMIKDGEMMHEILKNMFLKIQIPNEDGEFVEFVQSTTKLSTVEFTNYLEEIFLFASEKLGVFIPSPGSQSAFL